MCSLLDQHSWQRRLREGRRRESYFFAALLLSSRQEAPNDGQPTSATSAYSSTHPTTSVQPLQRHRRRALGDGNAACPTSLGSSSATTLGHPNAGPTTGGIPSTPVPSGRSVRSQSSFPTSASFFLPTSLLPATAAVPATLPLSLSTATTAATLPLRTSTSNDSRRLHPLLLLHPSSSLRRSSALSTSSKPLRWRSQTSSWWPGLFFEWRRWRWAAGRAARELPEGWVQF